MDTEELIDFRLSWEQSISISDLTHDTACGPNINFLSIKVAEKKLGSTIPTRGDIVG